MTKRRMGVAVAVALAVLSGCGGGGSSTAASNSSSGSSSSDASSSSAAPKADAATVARAKAGTVTAPDLGASWLKYADATTWTPPDATSCAASSPKAALPEGAIQVGPTLQYKDTKVFITSDSSVYADEASALAYTKYLASPAAIECRRSILSDEQKKTDPKYSVRTVETTAKGLGTGGFEAFAVYQFQFDDGSGVKDGNGQFTYYAFRVKNTVVLVVLNWVRTDKDPKDLITLVNTDLNKAVEKVYARL